MKKKEFWTIPNLITLYRLLMVPVILYFAISGREKLFAIFLVINLLSDIIDGYIARRFKMESEIGAKLDSFADNFNYVLAIIGFFIFKMDDLRPHLVSLIIFISMLLLTVIVPLIKFGKFPSFHLYVTKIGGYIQGAFFICLFTIGFIAPFYYFMIIWGMLGAVECIAIDMVIPEMRSNIKGLYWVLKERRAEKELPK
jgi:CDP-diacylglycerol--glycerol-3-phosphate 3-phosphatidyltransferase